MSEATYVIRMNLEMEEPARDALREIGVKFAPVDDMTCLLDPILDGIFMGRNAQDALDKANARLEERENPQRITTPFREMPASTRQKLLYMITHFTEWSSGYDPHIRTMEYGEWDRFLAENPGLCQDPGE